MPVVWCISCPTVTVPAHGGNSGRCWDNESFSVSLPASTSNSSAVAVNCLDTEAISKTVFAVIALPVDMSANPRTPVQMPFPLMPTAAEQPGASTSMEPSSTFWLPAFAAALSAATVEVAVGAACRPLPQPLSNSASAKSSLGHLTVTGRDPLAIL